MLYNYVVHFLFTGFFTQLVWRDSRWLGLGMARLQSRNGNWHYIVIANYDPKGNMYDIFPEMVLEPSKYGSPPKLPVPPINHHESARYLDHDFDSDEYKQLPQVPGLPYPCPDYKNLEDADNGAFILGDHFKGLYIPLVLALRIRNQFEQRIRLAEESEDDSSIRRSLSIYNIPPDPDLDRLGVNIPEVNSRIRTFYGFDDDKQYPWTPNSKEVLDLNLKLHNQIRAKHYAPPLKYDERVCTAFSTFGKSSFFLSFLPIFHIHDFSLMRRCCCCRSNHLRWLLIPTAMTRNFGSSSL